MRSFKKFINKLLKHGLAFAFICGGLFMFSITGSTNPSVYNPNNEVNLTVQVLSEIIQTDHAVPEKDANILAQNIYTISLKYHLNPAVVYGVIATESNFNPAARSSANARGLMQVLGTNTKGKSVWLHTLKEEEIINHEKDLHRAYSGIDAGCFVLSHYLDKTDGNLTKALSYYLGGPSIKNAYVGKVFKFTKKVETRLSEREKEMEAHSQTEVAIH